jgi:hypothetical protein
MLFPRYRWAYEPLPGSTPTSAVRKSSIRRILLLGLPAVAAIVVLWFAIRHFIYRRPYHPLDNYQKLCAPPISFPVSLMHLFSQELPPDRLSGLHACPIFIRGPRRRLFSLFRLLCHWRCGPRSLRPLRERLCSLHPPLSRRSCLCALPVYRPLCRLGTMGSPVHPTTPQRQRHSPPIPRPIYEAQHLVPRFTRYQDSRLP